MIVGKSGAVPYAALTIFKAERICNMIAKEA